MKIIGYNLLLSCLFLIQLSCNKDPEVISGWQDKLGGKIALITPARIYIIDSENNTKVYQANNLLGGVCFSPDGEKVTFSENGMLYTMETNGTNCHVIPCETNGIGSIANAAWSPDGNKIAFVAGGHTRKIYLMNPDGTGIEFLTKGLTPCWTIDGENIVYVIPNDNHSRSYTTIYNIYLLDRTIQKIAVLDIDPYYNWKEFVALSPDNKEILFVFGSTWSYNSHIGVMTIEGHQFRQLTQGYNVFNRFPCWSADSKKILYFSDSYEDNIYWGNPDLYAMNADGSDKVILKLPEELEPDEKAGLIWYNGSLSW